MYDIATQQGFGYCNIANCEFKNVRKAPVLFSYRLPVLDPTINQICSAMETSDVLSPFRPLVFIKMENLKYISACIQGDLLPYASEAKSVQIYVPRGTVSEFKVKPKVIPKISKKKRITLRIGTTASDVYLRVLKLFSKKNIFKLILERPIGMSSISGRSLAESKVILESIKNSNIKELDV